MPEHLFLPYRFGAGQLALAVRGVMIDGRPAGATDSTRRRVDLSGPTWGTAALSVEASIAEPDLLRLLPEDERPSPPCAALVVLECRETRLRSGFWLAPAGSRAGSWAGTVSLSRDLVRGDVSLDAFVVRTCGRAAPVPPFADRASLRLADADGWTLACDPSDSAVGDVLPEVRWESFSRSSSARVRALTGQLYALEVRPGAPVVLLNSDIGGMRSLLGSRATRGVAAAARDMLCDVIAQGVRLSLAAEALAAREEWTGSPDAWKAALARSLAPVYAGAKRPGAVAEELLDQVQRDVPMRGSIDSLLSALGSIDD